MFAWFGNKERKELARQHREVAARLDADPGAQRLGDGAVPIFVYQQFLPEDDCRLLIRAIDSSAEPSLLYSAEEEFRTSYSTNLDRFDPDIERIELRVCGLLGLSPRHGETLQGQRYAVGQEFKPHNDFFYTDQPYWKKEKKHGGQRSWTTMIYLNEPKRGGETGFEHLGFQVEPRRGMLLTWCNMNADGRPESRTLHSGEPVIKGTKYIVTKWFRRGNWI